MIPSLGESWVLQEAVKSLRGPSDFSGAEPGVLSAPRLHTPPHPPTHRTGHFSGSHSGTKDLRVRGTMSAQTLFGVHRVEAERASEVGAQPRPRTLPSQTGPEGREATPTCGSQSLHFLSSVL